MDNSRCVFLCPILEFHGGAEPQLLRVITCSVTHLILASFPSLSHFKLHPPVLPDKHSRKMFATSLFSQPLFQLASSAYTDLLVHRTETVPIRETSWLALACRPACSPILTHQFFPEPIHSKAAASSPACPGRQLQLLPWPLSSARPLCSVLPVIRHSSHLLILDI